MKSGSIHDDTMLRTHSLLFSMVHNYCPRNKYVCTGTGIWYENMINLMISTIHVPSYPSIDDNALI